MIDEVDYQHVTCSTRSLKDNKINKTTLVWLSGSDMASVLVRSAVLSMSICEMQPYIDMMLRHKLDHIMQHWEARQLVIRTHYQAATGCGASSKISIKDSRMNVKMNTAPTVRKARGAIPDHSARTPLPVCTSEHCTAFRNNPQTPRLHRCKVIWKMEEQVFDTFKPG